MNKVYCRYCGKQIDKDATFCTHCGKEQNINKIPSWGVDELGSRSKTVRLKLLALLRVPFDYAKTVKMPRINEEKVALWRKRLKWVGKILLTLSMIGSVIVASFWGYYEEYIPRKVCADILSKMYSDDDSIRVLYNYKILMRNEQLGYENVSGYDIKHRLRNYREEAFHYIENEAYNKKVFAQYCLGCLYVRENFICLPDTTKAAYWWNEAVKQDYIPAYRKLGLCYANGWGVKKNMRKAVDLFRMGAEKGEPRAQATYGTLYRDGVKIKVGSHKETRTTHDYMSDRIKEYWDYSRGQTMYVYMVDVDDYEILIPQDIEQAKYWWKKAAAQGNEYAKELLQKVYE